MTQDTDSDYFSDGSRTVSITTVATSQNLADGDTGAIRSRLIRLLLLGVILICLLWMLVQCIRLKLALDSDAFWDNLCETQCVCRNLTTPSRAQ